MFGPCKNNINLAETGAIRILHSSSVVYTGDDLIAVERVVGICSTMVHGFDTRDEMSIVLNKNTS